MANLDTERSEMGLDAFEPSTVEMARRKIEDARAMLSDADRKVRGFVLEHPFASLVGALAIGYAVGRVLRKL